ncbi:hypothetical protein TNCV_1844341 [Trichonephila clavipes]|nr:hypothetical protein TNCV_1844341 [Trichonephila clavipes]
MALGGSLPQINLGVQVEPERKNYSSNFWFLLLIGTGTRGSTAALLVNVVSNGPSAMAIDNDTNVIGGMPKVTKITQKSTSYEPVP